MGDLLAGHAPTVDEMIACAHREWRMRMQVYPRAVASGKMKQQTADNEIKVMRAIVDFLEQYRPR